MNDEQDDLAPLPRHQFDMVPQEITDVFDDILKWRVDPSSEYYGINLDSIVDRLKKLDNGAVVALDSEYRYERKGHMYDPILQSFVQGAGGRISNWTKEENNILLFRNCFFHC